MKKNKFFGKYYKCQNKDGYTIAFINSISNEGKMVQIINNDKSYYVTNISDIEINDHHIKCDIHQKDLSIKGELIFSNYKKVKKDIMSYFRLFPIECKHQIYSMNHTVNGTLIINDKEINFLDSDGYIEGDKGRNFPNKYLWLNSSKRDCSLTLAIATIPLIGFSIKGITCLIKTKDTEYLFGTYNFAKIIKLERNHLIIKKNKYELEIFISDFIAHKLKAPVKGDMVRFIHECPSVEINYTLKYKNKVIINKNDKYASYEFMFD